MAVKRKKYSSKTLPQKKSQEEYDLKLSFSRLNQYRSVDNSQTDSYKERKDSSSYLRSNQQQGLSYTSETSIGDSYFRLEDKISALSDKNDSAHTKLREDFDKKVDSLQGSINQMKQDDQSRTRWIIGTIVTIVIASVGYIVPSCQKTNDIHNEIIKIQTIIDERIKPSIEKNSENIESNIRNINNNTEKLYQIQTQQQNKKK